ncbi:MAG: hypothetical protein ACO1RX_04975 [Candidatus Sericytochromatia bacterium]
MKKFKVPPPAHSLPDPALQDVLSDTHLLRTALLRYAQLPLALILTLLMVLTSWLAGRPVLSFENMLLAYLALSGSMLLVMSHACFSFHRYASRLQHVPAGFVGQKRYPILVAALMAALGIALGWPVLLGVLLLWALIACSALGRVQGIGATLLHSLYMVGLLWLALVAPAAQLRPAAMGLTVLTGVSFALLHLRARRWLLLESAPVTERMTAETRPRSA